MDDDLAIPSNTVTVTPDLFQDKFTCTSTSEYCQEAIFNQKYPTLIFLLNHIGHDVERSTSYPIWSK